MTAPPEPSVSIAEAHNAACGDFLTITGVAERMEMNTTDRRPLAFVEIHDVTGRMWIRLTDTMLWKMALGRAGATDELAPRSLMDRLVMGVRIAYHGPLCRGSHGSASVGPRRLAPGDRFLDVQWAGEVDPDAALASLIDPDDRR